VEARFEGGQGPEGAVAPYMEWNGSKEISYDVAFLAYIQIMPV